MPKKSPTHTQQSLLLFTRKIEFVTWSNECIPHTYSYICRDCLGMEGAEMGIYVFMGTSYHYSFFPCLAAWVDNLLCYVRALLREKKEEKPFLAGSDYS